METDPSLATPAVRAAVDVGSNSAHLLVARVHGHDVEPLVDESVFLGLGDRVASDRRLGSDVRRGVADVLAGYVRTARDAAAVSVTLVGTEPARRAADAAALVAEVESAAGHPLHVLSHEEEAWLDLLGVTGGRRIGTEMAVVDSGGGSTEVVSIDPDGRHEAHAVRTGSARLTTALVRTDPPTRDEIRALRLEAARAVGQALPRRHPGELVAVGGTASNLAKLISGAFVDRRLTRGRLADVFELVATTRAAEIVTRYGLNPRRAPLLAAGAAVMEALLDHYSIDELIVSDAGIREGTVIAVAREPLGWRDLLPRLVAGWE